MSTSRIGPSQTMNYLQAVAGSPGSTSSSSSASLSHHVPTNTLPDYDSSIYQSDWDVEVIDSGSLPALTLSTSPFPVRINSPELDAMEEVDQEERAPRGPLDSIQAVLDTIDGIEVYDQTSDQLSGLTESDWGFVKDVTNLALERIKSEEGLALTFKEAEEVRGKKKNRFNNVKPFDHSIVKPFSQLEGKEVYVNANWIEMGGKKFIATQAPLPETRADFLRMIGQSGANVIATMAMVIEKDVTKGFAYWHGAEETKIASAGRESIVVRDVTVYELVDTGNGKVETPKTVKQVHYQNWPDHGTPNMELYNRFLDEVEHYAQNQPIVAHCSAGVGRTGVVIAGLSLRNEIREAKNSGTALEDIRVNIPKCVLKMRAQRNEMMVQTDDQFLFIAEHARQEIESD